MLTQPDAPGAASPLERRLRHEIAFRRAIEESILAGVAATDRSGTQIYVNRALADMLGWPAEELVGRRPPFPYWPPEEIERIEAAFAATLRGDAPRDGFELRFQRKNGERFDAHVLISPLREDGATTGWLASVHDVSDRRAAERRLRADEERLRLALDAGRLGAWEWDIANGRVHWSPELESIHGLEPGTFEGTFDAFRRDMHPEDADRVLDEIGRVVRSGQSGYRAEYRIVPPAGGIRWLEARGRVLPGPDGAPARMVGVCADVTERKRIERRQRLLSDASALLASSLDPTETLRSLTRLAVPELADWCAVRALGEDGTLAFTEVAHVDPAKAALARELERCWPLAPDAPVGWALAVRTGESRLQPRVDAAQLEAAARDDEHLRILCELGIRSTLVVPLRARGAVAGALTLATAESGREYDLEDLAVAEELATRAALALENARLFRQAGRARAAAERAAERMRILAGASDALASTLEYEATLQQLADYCTSTLADYCVTYSLEANGTIRRVGFSHADPSKRGWVGELARAGPPALDDRYGAGAVLRTGEPILVSEIPEPELPRFVQNEEHLEVLRKLRPRSSIIVPLRASGRVVGALALAATADSARRYTADDLLLTEELAARAALLVHNARSYREARQAVAARDEMMAVVSHDLKGPLQTILLGCELVRQQGAAGATRVDAIRRAADQMDRLIRDLLDVSRLEGGQMPMERAEIDVASLLEEALTLHRPLAEEKGTHLEVATAGVLPVVHGDRERLMQVLANLIGNALKFVPPGGRVTLRADADASEVRLEIDDTGPGIPAEQLPHVFDRFWRGPGHPGSGTGLGLAIARGIVEAHGGRIEVASAAGRGSTFRVRLPLRG